MEGIVEPVTIEIHQTVMHTPRGPIPCFARPSTQDWNTLYSCLTDDEYGIYTTPGWQGGYGLDIGGHIGAATMAMMVAGFAYVRVIEPLPENVDMIHRNLEANGWSNRVDVIWGAVGDPKVHPFQRVAYTEGDDESARVHRFIGHTVDPDGAAGVRVRTYGASDLIVPPVAPIVTLLKIDCEGAEWEFFEAADMAPLIGVQRVVAELHDDGQSTRAMRKRLADALPSKFRDESSQFGDDVVAPTSICHADFRQ